MFPEVKQASVRGPARRLRSIAVGVPMDPPVGDPVGDAPSHPAFTRPMPGREGADTPRGPAVASPRGERHDDRVPRPTCRDHRQPEATESAGAVGDRAGARRLRRNRRRRGRASGPQPPEPITLYTCVSDEIDPAGHRGVRERATAGGQVDLFRAPTGELNARVAADVRSGGLRADVIWGCDPLTVQAYVDQDLVGGWTPPEADAIPEEFRTDDYVGAHVLYMVAVHRTDVPAPAAWSDLTGATTTRSPYPIRRWPPRRWARWAGSPTSPATGSASTAT